MDATLHSGVFYSFIHVCMCVTDICFCWRSESSLTSGADPCPEKQTPASFHHQPGVQSQGTGINWSLNKLERLI